MKDRFYNGISRNEIIPALLGRSFDSFGKYSIVSAAT
jgi:hypothetical protein